MVPKMFEPLSVYFLFVYVMCALGVVNKNVDIPKRDLKYNLDDSNVARLPSSW